MKSHEIQQKCEILNQVAGHVIRKFKVIAIAKSVSWCMMVFMLIIICTANMWHGKSLGKNKHLCCTTEENLHSKYKTQ